jgi:hypothetical protein
MEYSNKEGRALRTSDLVLGAPNSSSVIAMDKIAKISAWEKTTNQVYTSGLEIVLVDGESVKYAGQVGLLEIEWADSLVRTRAYTSHFINGSLEFDKPKK